MLDSLTQTLNAYETTISAIVGLLTLCAALWGALRLTLLRRSEATDSAMAAAQSGVENDRPGQRRRWSRLLNLGLGEHSRLEQLVSVRSANVVLLALGCTSLLWLVASFTSSSMTVLTAVNLVVFVGVLIAFALQWQGSTGAARWLLVLVADLYWIGALLSIGPLQGTEYFLAGLVIIPVLVFSRGELGQMVLALALTLLVFVAGVILSRLLPPALILPPPLDSIGYQVNAILLAGILFASVRYYRQFASSSYHELEAQKAHNDVLISNLFPRRVLQRFQNEGMVADWHADATVLYVSLGGFSRLHKRVPAIELVGQLAEIYARFDGLVEQHGLDKIKTLGTSYVAANGVGGQEGDPDTVATCALQMRDALDEFVEETRWPLTFRCGIATGITISGVIADARPRFDIWGEALGLAARLGEQADQAAIHTNDAAYWRLQEHFRLTAVDGRGEVFRLEGRSVTHD